MNYELINAIQALSQAISEAPDKKGLLNCVEGDNYLRGGEYRALARLVEAADAVLFAYASSE
jgi:hypothetical protein